MNTMTLTDARGPRAGQPIAQRATAWVFTREHWRFVVPRAQITQADDTGCLPHALLVELDARALRQIASAVQVLDEHGFEAVRLAIIARYATAESEDRALGVQVEYGRIVVDRSFGLEVNAFDCDSGNAYTASLTPEVAVDVLPEPASLATEADAGARIVILEAA